MQFKLFNQLIKIQLQLTLEETKAFLLELKGFNTALAHEDASLSDLWAAETKDIIASLEGLVEGQEQDVTVELLPPDLPTWQTLLAHRKFGHYPMLCMIDDILDRKLNSSTTGVPYSPEVTIPTLSKIRSVLDRSTSDLDATIRYLHDKLTNEEYALKALQGLPDDPHYAVKVPRKLSEKEMKLLTLRLREAGWSRVLVKALPEDQTTGVKLCFNPANT